LLRREISDNLSDMDIIRDAEKRLKEDLLRYAETFVEITGIKVSNLGRLVLKDGSFMSEVGLGKRQLTPRQYDKLITFMDAELAARKAKLEAIPTQHQHAPSEQVASPADDVPIVRPRRSRKTAKPQSADDGVGMGISTPVPLVPVGHIRHDP